MWSAGCHATRWGAWKEQHMRPPLWQPPVALSSEETAIVRRIHRERCTTSARGRSVSIHPDERFLAELRERQQTPVGRAKLREQVAIEHTLAHVGHWQGRRARYRGQRKNLFDLRRCALVDNLHVLSRLPRQAERRRDYSTGALGWRHNQWRKGASALTALPFELD